VAVLTSATQLSCAVVPLLLTLVAVIVDVDNRDPEVVRVPSVKETDHSLSSKTVNSKA